MTSPSILRVAYPKTMKMFVFPTSLLLVLDPKNRPFVLSYLMKVYFFLNILLGIKTTTKQSIHRIIRQYMCNYLDMGRTVDGKKSQIRLQESRSSKDTHSYCFMDTLNVVGCHYGKCLSRGRVLTSAEAVLFLLHFLYIYCSHKRKFHISLYCTIKYNGLTQHNNVCT